MSTLAIVTPPVTPPAPAAPGKLVDVPAAARPGDAPRAGVIVRLSQQVRELTEAEKQDADERKARFRSKKLTQDQEQQVRDLEKTDREVRSHEAAHKAAAGAYARGAAQFETVTGPNGRRYAVGGEVAIDTSPVSGNPEATARKMEQVARAALAPSDPSAQDRAVAAQARQTASEARRDIVLERAEEHSARTEEAREDAAGKNRLDAPGELDDATAPERLDAPSDATEPTDSAGIHRRDDAVALRERDAREPGRAAEVPTEATVHGHSAQDSCPLCQAQGGQSARPHGALDRSA